MFRLLLCLSLLFFGSLTATHIDNIEYHLPTSPEWELEEDAKNSFGHAKIYLPEDDYYSESFQMLTVQMFSLPYVQHEIEEIEHWLQIAFPYLEMRCKLLNQDEDSMMFEIYGYDDENLELYLLLRQIRSENGYVLFNYTFDCVDEDLQEIKNLWIPLLQRAKPIEHQE